MDTSHYPCENISLGFYPSLLMFVPLNAEPAPVSPEHWVPWIQGLCLFSYAHPFQTHIFQARIPKAILLFNHQLKPLSFKPLFDTLNAIFSYSSS